MLDPITSTFLMGLARSVPGLISDWLKTRNQIRLEYTRGWVNERGEQARHQQWRERTEYPAVLASYPLGVPGRLGTLFQTPGRLPLILVSPLPPGAWPSLEAIPERVHELLGAADKMRLYAQVVSGAFARDAGVSRYIDGEVAARTVAGYEFSREPAVLVYFEQGVRTLTAHAYLSTVFGSVGGESSFSFVIARYTRDPACNVPPVTSLGGDLPAWRLINLSAFAPSDASDVVAQTVTWFLLAVIDAYWELKNGNNPRLLSSAGAVPLSGHPAIPADRKPDHTTEASIQFLGNYVDLRIRLEHEARQFAGTGFEVTAEELPDGHVGMHVRGRGKDVVFVVDSHYPDAPPVAIQVGEELIGIDASDWSSECTLMDLVEAIK